MNATWLILPAYQRTSALPYAFDVLEFVAIGAIWVYACLFMFERDVRRGTWAQKETASWAG